MKKRKFKKMWIALSSVILLIAAVVVFFRVPYSPTRARFESLTSAQIDAAEPATGVFSEADIAGLEAQIAYAESQLEHYTVRALDDGVVLSLGYDEGGLALAGTQICEVSKENQKKFVFYLPEEYIDYIKEFTFGDKHLAVECDDGKYEIYYTKGTEIKVPKNKTYAISGNNIDGFIITIKQ
jgi:hypothetical protein